ncbi:M16 family metallopeptidase [Oleiharenicola lentus]|uniref:M16 family metallopeptidase n=1 Tax=Oleiharenicola lentus TaxID=2508720 RepID=UPI003F668853
MKWGRLENGLRYAILPNAEPKTRASLRLMVFAGSLHEADDQQGLAHFVEHMAFNGTRLYPKETIRGVLQKFGMASGADSNAFTSLNATFYKLEMPTNEPGRLFEGLQVLREFADGVTFDPEEVEREKGVIESERVARNDSRARTGEAFRKFVFKDTLLENRSPIGQSEMITSAAPAKLSAFYKKWYRADNMLLVLVGDFDPGEAEKGVSEKFASLETPTTPLPAVAFTVPAGPAEFVAEFFPSGVKDGAVSIQLINVWPYQLRDTRETRRQTSIMNMAFAALGVRLKSAQLREGKNFGVMNAGVSAQAALFHQAVVRFDANGRNWRKAVTRAEQELRRALTHGFAESEIQEVSASMLVAFEHQVRTVETRTSAGLADRLMNSVANQRVFTKPETDLEIVRAALAELNGDELLKAFRHAWGSGKPRIFASESLPAGIGAAQIVKVAQESARKRVAAAKATNTGEFAYTNFGPPGAIAKRTHVEDLDIHCVEFANGVKLNLKSTDYMADAMVFSARFGSGTAGEPVKKPGLRYVMGHGFTTLGLGKHSHDDLNHLSAGLVFSFGVRIEDDAFVAEGSTDTTNAERWLRIFTASLVDPGWRKEALPGVQKRILHTLNTTKDEAMSALTASRSAQLTRHDSRFVLPAYKTIEDHSVADLRAWVEPQLKTAPIEVGIVGDFDVDEMIELAANTLGSLPKRGAVGPSRPIKFAPVVKPAPLIVPNTERRGAVQVAWPLPAKHDHANVRLENLLATVLKNRLVENVREKMGATYSPTCGVWRSELQRENGYLIALLTCAPGDTHRIAEVVRDVAAELARSGATDEELARAREPMIQSVPAQLRSNNYWLNAAVAEAQSRAEVLEFPRTRISDLEKIKTTDVTTLAAQVLVAEKASLFTAYPAASKTK